MRKLLRRQLRTVEPAAELALLAGELNATGAAEAAGTVLRAVTLRSRLHGVPRAGFVMCIRAASLVARPREENI